MSSSTSPSLPGHPHGDIEVHERGAPLDEARAAVILLHGRGARAEGMLRLADRLALSSIAYLAPQARQRTWYPYSFLAPIDQNEPFLTSALQAVGETLQQVRDEGPPAERIVLGGFSQGACLSLEYAARHPRRYGGIAAFSGGLIGPEDHRFDYDGSLAGTPAFLGCSDQDPHIPLSRVQESTRIYREMDADVTERIYPDMGHTVNDDEIGYLRDLLEQISAS